MSFLLGLIFLLKNDLDLLGIMKKLGHGGNN